MKTNILIYSENEFESLIKLKEEKKQSKRFDGEQMIYSILILLKWKCIWMANKICGE